MPSSAGSTFSKGVRTAAETREGSELHMTTTIRGAEHEHPTKLGILRVAIQELDDLGQGGFRIAHVIKTSRASYSSLYHHFGSREALIREAQAHRYVPIEQGALTRCVESARDVATFEEFARVFAQFVTSALNDETARAERRRNAEVLGFAMTDDDLLARIVRQQHDELLPMRQLLTGLQRRALVRPDLNVDAYLAWLLGMFFGHMLLEIDPVLGPSSAAWDKCALLALLQPLTYYREPLPWSDEWLQRDSYPDVQDTTSVPPLGEASTEPAAPSLHPTAQALLDRTKELLATEGEEALRLPMILDGLATSVTSLYHFFGSREGLIMAAHADRFVDRTNESVQAFATAASRTSTSEEFLAFLTIIINISAYEPHFVQFRKTRTQVLGAAMSRPLLLESISKRQRETFLRFAGVTDGAKRRGQVRPDLETAPTTLWFQGIQLGRVLTEIDPSLADNEGWASITIEGLAAALRPES